MPVVRPLAYRDSTAWMATYMAGTLKSSNISVVIFSRLILGFMGACRVSGWCVQVCVGGYSHDTSVCRLHIKHRCWLTACFNRAPSDRQGSAPEPCVHCDHTSVSITGRVLTSMRSSLSNVWRQMASISCKGMTRSIVNTQCSCKTSQAAASGLQLYVLACCAAQDAHVLER